MKAETTTIKSKKTARVAAIIDVEPLAEFMHLGFNFFVYSDVSGTHVIEETTGRAVTNVWPIEKNTRKVINNAKNFLNTIGQSAITEAIQKHGKI